MEKISWERLITIRTGCAALWFVIYSILIYSLFCGIGMNSDFASLVLEAADFLSGNVFLDGWAQTGISFLTTDFIYFCIGVLIAGIGPTAFAIACTLMFLVFTILARLLMRTSVQGYTIRKELMFLAIAGIPCTFALVAAQSHIGGMIWVMAAILVLLQIENRNEKRRKYESVMYALYILFLTLACIGDAIGFVTGIAPILIVSFVRVLRNDDKRRQMYVIVSTLFAAGLSRLFNRLYYMFGNVVQNDYLGGWWIFDDPTKYLYNLTHYATRIFKMNNAGFMGVEVMSPETVFLFLHALIVLAAAGIVIEHIYRFFKEGNNDTASLVLGMGFALMTVIMVLTNIGQNDDGTGRYFSFVPVVFAVLIVRYIDCRLIRENGDSAWAEFPLKEIRKYLPSRKYAAALTLVSLLLIIGFNAAIALTPVETPQSRLADYLAEQGLKNGYADFWDASSVTVFSGNEVTVRAVIGVDDKLHAYNWFCKGDWYERPADFIVVGDPNPHGVSEELVIQNFGQPAHLKEFGDYKVYIYGYDISEYLGELRASDKVIYSTSDQ